MATYMFEAITAAQALAITAADTLTIAGVPANQVTVLYNAGGTITIVAGARSVEFGSPITAISLAGRLVRVDGGRLFIGDDAANTANAPVGTALTDGLYGGSGADVLEGGLGDDLLQGNPGRDYIVGGGGREIIYGGQDDDLIHTTINAETGEPFPSGDGGDFAQGNKGNDTMIGGFDADTLLGGQGNDQINGILNGARDFLNGNLGDDRVDGQGQLLGEDGNDTLIGRGVADTLIGGDGQDRILVSNGYAEGGAGNDFVEIGTSGPSGNITVLGGDGADTIDGHFSIGAFDQSLSGDEGDDSLLGTSGADTLVGGNGNDTIASYGGLVDERDTLSGGAGQDVFLIRNSVFNATTGLPLDTSRISDWQTSDRIQFQLDGFPGATAANYREITAASLDAADSMAQALREQGVVYVAAQVGGDVAVFGTTFNFLHAAVILTGRTLDDISMGNFG